MKTLAAALSTEGFELDVERSMIRLGTEWFPALVALVHEDDTMRERTAFWGGKNTPDGVSRGWCVSVPMENGALLDITSEYVENMPALSVYLTVPFWQVDRAAHGIEMWQQFASHGNKTIYAHPDGALPPCNGVWAECDPSWVAELIMRLRTYTVAPVRNKKYPQKYAPLAMCPDFFQED